MLHSHTDQKRVHFQFLFLERNTLLSTFLIPVTHEHRGQKSLISISLSSQHEGVTNPINIRKTLVHEHCTRYHILKKIQNTNQCHTENSREILEQGTQSRSWNSPISERMNKMTAETGKGRRETGCENNTHF